MAAARRRRAASLRRKILLTVLVGGVAPLGILGLWLTRSAERAGERLLREQLDVTLAEVEREIEARWVFRRSDLLLLAENDAVQRALPRARSDVEDGAALRFLHEAYAGLEPAIERVLYRDLGGTPRWTLLADPAQAPQALASGADGWRSIVPAGADLPVVIPIRDAESGAPLGRMEARVRMSSLLPAGAERRGPSGSVLGALEIPGGAQLLPTPFDPTLLRNGHFTWDEQRWLVARRVLEEPALELVMAAPLDAYTAPFERTARHGVIALLVVAFCGAATAAHLSRRITFSLERLTEAADAVSRGELQRTVDVAGDDEVARVAGAFNLMIASLQRTLGELAQREALAAVGEFASALAHEVRNPLTAVRLDLQHLQEKLPDERRVRAPLERALAGVDRLERAVSGSLRIARSGRVAHAPLDLHTVLEGALHDAAPHFRAAGAEVEAPLEEPPGLRVRGDEGALGQLFLNLLINAAQALGPGGRAGIRIDASPGEVAVTVWDRGRGIPPADLERVRQPFFSTKPEGTGLGLAVAERIAAAHGGGLQIESSPGCGTSVRVRLPAAVADADPRHRV